MHEEEEGVSSRFPRAYGGEAAVHDVASSGTRDDDDDAQPGLGELRGERLDDALDLVFELALREANQSAWQNDRRRQDKARMRVGSLAAWGEGRRAGQQRERIDRGGGETEE